jgi:hypothetical protein
MAKLIRGHTIVSHDNSRRAASSVRMLLRDRSMIRESGSRFSQKIMLY